MRGSIASWNVLTLWLILRKWRLSRLPLFSTPKSSVRTASQTSQTSLCRRSVPHVLYIFDHIWALYKFFLGVQLYSDWVSHVGSLYVKRIEKPASLADLFWSKLPKNLEVLNTFNPFVRLFNSHLKHVETKFSRVSVFYTWKNIYIYMICNSCQWLLTHMTFKLSCAPSSSLGFGGGGGIPKLGTKIRASSKRRAAFKRSWVRTSDTKRLLNLPRSQLISISALEGSPPPSIHRLSQTLL